MPARSRFCPASPTRRCRSCRRSERGAFFLVLRRSPRSTPTAERHFFFISEPGGGTEGPVGRWHGKKLSFFSLLRGLAPGPSGRSAVGRAAGVIERRERRSASRALLGSARSFMAPTPERRSFLGGATTPRTLPTEIAEGLGASYGVLVTPYLPGHICYGILVIGDGDRRGAWRESRGSTTRRSVPTATARRTMPTETAEGHGASPRGAPVRGADASFRGLLGARRRRRELWHISYGVLVMAC